MTKADKIKLTLAPDLEHLLQTMIAKQSSDLLGKNTTVSVKNKSTPAGASLKVLINSNGAIAKEFGSFSNPARPWFSLLKKQIAPALSSILPAHLKLKK